MCRVLIYDIPAFCVGIELAGFTGSSLSRVPEKRALTVV